MYELLACLWYNSTSMSGNMSDMTSGTMSRTKPDLARLSIGRLLWPLTLALSVVVISPGISHAQFSEPLPLIDGKRWQQALRTLGYAHPSRPAGNASPYATIENAFATLARYTPQDRLVQMLKDPNPNLRPFAFWALEARNPGSTEIFNIAFAMMRDEDTAISGGGCMRSTIIVGDAIMESMVDSLTEGQRRRVLDYLMYEPNRLRLTDRALRDWTIPARYRNALRAMADKGRGSAVIALGRIGDERDVQFIIDKSEKLGHSVIEVAKQFPRDEYFEHLKAISTTIFAEEWPGWMYYRALAVYGAERAVPVMLAALEVPAERRAQHAGRVFDAVSDAVEKDAGFLPVLWQLWETAQQVNGTTFELMWANDKQRAQRLMRATLQGNNLERIPGALLVRMLRLSSGTGVNSVDSAMWTRVLDKVNYFNIEEIVSYLGQFRPQRAIDPLFARLASNHNEYHLDSIARAILAYDNEKLRARLKEVVAAHKHLHTGWVGDRIADVLEKDGQPEQPFAGFEPLPPLP